VTNSVSSASLSASAVPSLYTELACEVARLHGREGKLRASRRPEKLLGCCVEESVPDQKSSFMKLFELPDECGFWKYGRMRASFEVVFS
jgi:hypothetical protein